MSADTNAPSGPAASRPDAVGAPYAGAPQPGAPARAVVTLPVLARMAAEGRRIAMLTAYDATFAAAADRAGVDVLLVGDSLGMVVQGHPSTLPVSLADVLYHVRCVAAARTKALLIADLPFGTYQQSPESAYEASVAALKAGAAMVKLEGGAWLAPTVAFLTERSIPVCGHVGLQPQSVNMLGGYRVQGKTRDAADALLAEARALEAAGAAMLVVECVPPALGEALTRAARIPVIGIGAGPSCSGQVLVIFDALGVTGGKPARFVRNFMTGHESIEAALAAFVAAVRDGSFPGPEHWF
jgi:3-methyl-2-oxobutanoate hydroxymethyltransferase